MASCSSGSPPRAPETRDRKRAVRGVSAHATHLLFTFNLIFFKKQIIYIFARLHSTTQTLMFCINKICVPDSKNAKTEKTIHRKKNTETEKNNVFQTEYDLHFIKRKEFI